MREQEGREKCYRKLARKINTFIHDGDGGNDAGGKWVAEIGQPRYGASAKSHGGKDDALPSLPLSLHLAPRVPRRISNGAREPRVLRIAVLIVFRVPVPSPSYSLCLFRRPCLNADWSADERGDALPVVCRPDDDYDVAELSLYYARRDNGVARARYARRDLSSRDCRGAVFFGI